MYAAAETRLYPWNTLICLLILTTDYVNPRKAFDSGKKSGEGKATDGGNKDSLIKCSMLRGASRVRKQGGSDTNNMAPPPLLLGNETPFTVQYNFLGTKH